MASNKSRKRKKAAPHRVPVSGEDAQKLAEIIVSLVVHPIPLHWNQIERARTAIMELSPVARERNVAMAKKQIVAFFNGEFDAREEKRGS